MSSKVPVIHTITNTEEAISPVVSLLAANNLTSNNHHSTKAFLDSYQPTYSGCILVDIDLEGTQALDLLSELSTRNSTLPVIFLSHNDKSRATVVMEPGKIKSLQSPLDEKELITTIKKALQINHSNENTKQRKDTINGYYEKLTNREKEVLHLMMKGHQNKAIAAELKLSRRTVEIHRANVMRKMKTASVAQLVQMTNEIKACGDLA